MKHHDDYPQERIIIGKILKPRGLSGEVKILPLTDIPGRFEQLDEVYVEIGPGNVRSISIDQVKSYKGFVYLHFHGINSVEEVEELREKYLQVERSQVPDLPENEFYHFEIIDAEVYIDDGQYVGIVVDILETGAHDVFIVRDEGREYLIPSHPDIITQIDRTAARITIHPLEGLLDI